MARPKTMLGPKLSKEQSLIPVGSKPSSVNEALADIHKAGGYTGFLGDNLVKKPDYVAPPENLDVDGLARKKAITDLLMSVIEPFQLSSKSTVEMDRRALFAKLRRCSLDDLKKFLPDRIKRLPTEKLLADTVTDGEKIEIQENYRDISP